MERVARSRAVRPQDVMPTIQAPHGHRSEADRLWPPENGSTTSSRWPGMPTVGIVGRVLPRWASHRRHDPGRADDRLRCSRIHAGISADLGHGRQGTATDLHPRRFREAQEPLMVCVKSCDGPRRRTFCRAQGTETPNDQGPAADLAPDRAHQGRGYRRWRCGGDPPGPDDPSDRIRQ